MNLGLLYALADLRTREIRYEAAPRRNRPHQARSRSGRRSGWRRRTGFVLVEAGLHLLATTGPQARP